MQSLRLTRLAGAVSLVAGAVAFATIVGAQSPQSPQTAATAGAHHMVHAKAIVWQPAPPSMPPGPKVAVLHGDPAKEGYFVMRLKAPDGFKVPPHYHPSDENLTILQGTFMIGTGEKADPAGLKPLNGRRLHVHAEGDAPLRDDERRDDPSDQRHGAVRDHLRESRRRPAQ